MPTVKEEVKLLLDTLPDDCSLEDVQYHLYVIEKIQHGMQVPTKAVSRNAATTQRRA